MTLARRAFYARVFLERALVNNTVSESTPGVNAKQEDVYKTDTNTGVNDEIIQYTQSVQVWIGGGGGGYGS